MMNNKNFTIKFLRDNKQVIYSIGLMIIIPGVIVLNTWLFSQSFSNAVDLGIQNKTVGIAQSINTAMSNDLDSPERMQTFLDKWNKYNEDTTSLDIFYKEGNDFKLVAGLDKERIGGIDNSTNYSIAWDGNWPIAQKIVERSSGNYYWVLAVPLKDFNKEKKALLVMRSSASIMDTVLSVALTKSYFVLIFSVIAIILLLLVNSRLFEHAMLYSKIKEIDKMKDEFISMASHELRTPVTVIRGYVVMLIDEAKRLSITEEALEYLSVIKISTERLNNLIEDLLNVSRIEQGRMKMELQAIDVKGIVEDTVKEFQIQAKEKNLVLSCSSEEGLFSTVNVDKDKFKQILINIIGNAIKYTPSGSVDVKLKDKENSLIIVVKDSGIGMSAKERERLFEKFYRIRNKNTDDIIGTGLGLWITKQIIELMNGSISVDSMEGVGSQFTLDFPLVKNESKK